MGAAQSRACLSMGNSGALGGHARTWGREAWDDHLWRETPLYTEDADAPWRRFCAALLPALLEARAALFGGGKSLLKPAAHALQAMESLAGLLDVLYLHGLTGFPKLLAVTCNPYIHIVWYWHCPAETRRLPRRRVAGCLSEFQWPCKRTWGVISLLSIL